MTGRKSKSLGIVLKSGRLGSVIEVKRIEGLSFDSKQAGTRSHIDVMLVDVCSRYVLGDNFWKTLNNLTSWGAKTRP
jgi:hypothetical protein